MIERSQEKIQAYISMLRQKLLADGSPLESVYQLEDHDVLEMFRRCCDCEDYLFTKGQEIHAILEFDSPERAYQVLYEDHNIEDDVDLALHDQGHIDDDYEGERDELISLFLKPGGEADFDEKLLRAKGIMDGSHTLDDAINNIELYIKLLKSYKAQGFELAIPVEDDYGYLIREKNEQEEQEHSEEQTEEKS